MSDTNEGRPPSREPPGYFARFRADSLPIRTCRDIFGTSVSRTRGSKTDASIDGFSREDNAPSGRSYTYGTAVASRTPEDDRSKVSEADAERSSNDAGASEEASPHQPDGDTADKPAAEAEQEDVGDGDQNPPGEGSQGAGDTAKRTPNAVLRAKLSEKELETAELRKKIAVLEQQLTRKAKSASELKSELQKELFSEYAKIQEEKEILLDERFATNEDRSIFELEKQKHESFETACLWRRDLLAKQISFDNFLKVVAQKSKSEDEVVADNLRDEVQEFIETVLYEAFADKTKVAELHGAEVNRALSDFKAELAQRASAEA